MKKNDIKAEIRDMLSYPAGFVRAEKFSELEKFLPEKTVMVSADKSARTDPFLEFSWAKTFIVCLLPYYSGGERTALSRYAWGKDYHAVMREYLSPVCVYLAGKGLRAHILCDNHPLNDRYLAYKAGLGFFGRSGMLINDRFGSYTFIGSVVTDAEIEPDAPLGKSCAECGECERKCPGGAISAEGVCGEKCVSYLTQKKGVLTDDEADKIRKSGYIWGCDICQEVCPHNKYAEITDIYAFLSDLIKYPEIDENMSERGFRRKYSGRAFAWRGKSTILRNIDIQNM